MQSLQPGDPAGVGPYRLLARLGAGGMGVVYLARSPGARLVALKLIRREFAADQGFRDRFRREIAAAGRVSGLYTAPVLDFDAGAPQPWLAAAYVPAPTLDEALAAIGTMPEPAVRALGAGLAEALQAIHGAGLVHRDLNPSNILLAEDGPRIIDFGIAKVTDATRLTDADGMIGTLAFMAPEQLAGGEHAGPAADLFSLAGVLVYAATGARPFGERDSAALLYEVMYGDPWLDRVPASLRELLAACLHKEPARRPALAAVLAALTPADPQALISPALRREVAAREAEANRVSSGPLTPPPPLPQVDGTDGSGLRRRRFLGLAAVAVAVTGAAGGTTAWALTRKTTKAAKPSPHTTALTAAPRPTWTFTPPVALTDGAVVRVTAAVVLFGAFEGVWGVDALSGRQLWTQDFHLSSGSAVVGSTFIALGGYRRLLTLIDARTGRATMFPADDGTIAGEVYGVTGDTVFLQALDTSLDGGSVLAVELTGGKIRWRFPFTGDVSGAADQTGVYLNSKHTLTALDVATGRERWAYDWRAAGQNDEPLGISVTGGRVFGDFADRLQAVDTARGKPVWSWHADKSYPTALPSGADVIFRGDDLRAYDRATGAARWTLAAPAPLSISGRFAAADGILAAGFGGFSGYAQGIFAARTDGRGLWAHWGPTFGNDDWEAAVSGSSVFATDQRRLYCFPAGS